MSINKHFLVTICCGIIGPVILIPMTVVVFRDYNYVVDLPLKTCNTIYSYPVYQQNNIGSTLLIKNVSLNDMGNYTTTIRHPPPTYDLNLRSKRNLQKVFERNKNKEFSCLYDKEKNIAFIDTININGWIFALIISLIWVVYLVLMIFLFMILYMTRMLSMDDTDISF